jgi:DNA polymerase
MSRFRAALDFVLSELDQRQDAGYADWRVATSAVQRLRNARAGQSAVLPALHEPSARENDRVPVGKDIVPVPPVTVPAPLLPVILKEEPAGFVASPAPTAGATLSKAQRLDRLRTCAGRAPCSQCPYGTQPHEHFVFGVGSPGAELMFVGEAPGAEEDAQGEPFVGKAGQLLTRIINTMGYPREDVYIANVLKCRPDTPGQTSGNRVPRPDEMQSCRPTLFEQIEIIAPRVIVALGATAVKGLLELDAPMRDLHGRWHDFRGIPLMPTYHPSYLLRNQAPSERRKVWEDMLLVKEKLGHDITERDRAYFVTRG